MAIIIDNMKLPNTCSMCWISRICELHVNDLKHDGFEHRLDGCPLHEMIRCKDCVHHKPFMGAYQCDVHGWVNTEEDYCSFGERKEG